MTWRVFLFLFLVFGTSGLNGQTAPAAAPKVNPFELLARLPKLAATGTASDTSSVVRAPVNPFDMAPHRAPPAAKSLSARLVEDLPREPRKLLTLPRGDTLSDAGIFWVLVLVLVFLTFSVTINRSAVGRAWQSFLYENALVQTQREAAGYVGNTPYLMLYANFLLNAGVFIFLVMRTFQHDLNNLPFLSLCVALSSVLFLFKGLLLRFVAWLFPLEKEVKRYLFLILVFNCVLGLFLVPFNFLVAFAKTLNVFLVFWTLGLVAIFYAYRGLRSLTIGVKFLGGDQFHFLLYLCAVEIAPVAILLKLAMLQAS